MRRLSDFQRVTIMLEYTRVVARVVATAGETVWLEIEDDGRDDIVENLPGPAEVGFEHRGQPVLLCGEAHIDASGCVVFRTGDYARVRNMRDDPRVEVSIPVTVTPAHVDGTPAGTPRSTQTIDLSASGSSLACTGLGPVGEWVEVRLAPAPDIEVVCIGRIVRSAPTGTAITFTRIDEASREVLAHLVIELRRRLTRRVLDRREGARRRALGRSWRM
jgi:hypothetical protein